MEDYRLVPIMGFGVDTTLAILRLTFSGVMERLPRLKLVAAHTGGVFQQLRGRIEIAYRMYPECRVNISSPPSTYLKRVWVDTVCYDSDILASVRAFSGSEKMLLGSDYPHQIGDLDHAVGRVKRMKLGEDQERGILGENAAKLLKL
jgi:aminocarboxymuconate-semialdehyde decarboxylase